MSQLQPLPQLISQLNIPVQDLDQLTSFDSNRANGVNAWVRSLPLTQIQFVSGLLYQVLPDVGRLKTSPENRLAILETLRPPTMQAIEGLAQGFLNQPLILPEPAVKTATIAQALQKHLINGYLVVVRDLVNTPNTKPETLALAIHRSITGLGLLLLRYFQLYVPVSAQVWTELHSLYQIALHLGISETPVVDPLPQQSQSHNIELAYIKTLLIACARPNQLRQDEILYTYEALDSLVSLAIIQDAESSNRDNLFAVALNSNRPPLYRSRFENTDDYLIELNTAQICSRLTEINTSMQSEHQDATAWRNELKLTSSLTLHLIQAWNVIAQRAFERQSAQGTLDVAVGLTNIHYFLAGNTQFTHFLNRTQQVFGEGKGIFQKRDAQLKPTSSIKAQKDDPWGKPFEASQHLLGEGGLSANIEFTIQQREENALEDSVPVYTVPLVDTSPGGYCIEWRDEIPTQVKAGELLGLKEKSRQRWIIGVVRWVNQTRGATQLGVQILAPQASPVAIAIVHKTGGYSEYLRALEIPALKAINQPATLITNAVTFKEYNKIKVFRRTDEGEAADATLQLTRRIFATGAFSQFTYRELMSATKPAPAEKTDDFDSIWDS